MSTAKLTELVKTTIAVLIIGAVIKLLLDKVPGGAAVRSYL